MNDIVTPQCGEQVGRPPKKSHSKLSTVKGIVLAFSLFLGGYAAYYGNAWKEQSELINLIKNSSQTYHIANEEENLNFLRKVYFPIDESEFPHMNRLHAHIDWKEHVANTTWINEVRNNNPNLRIPYITWDSSNLIFGDGIKISQRDSILVPYRNK